MEFFEYSSYAQAIVEQFNGAADAWLYFLIGGLCFAIIYVFRSVGLFVIAKREGIKHKWMVFIPFFSTYYIGVCGQKNRFLNIDTRIVGTIAAVLEFMLVGLYILDIVAAAAVQPYISYTTEELVPGFQVTTPMLDVTSLLAIDPGLSWAGWCYNYLDVYIISWLNFVYMLVMVVLLNCFFQTYSTRRYFLFTITSVLFPVQGILIFAVRNNKGMSYAEYMRRMQEQMYRQYRSQQGFDQNPYNQNPYSRNQYGNPPEDAPRGNTQEPPHTKTDDPFAEFGGQDGSDPFDEFKN